MLNPGDLKEFLLAQLSNDEEDKLCFAAEQSARIREEFNRQARGDDVEASVLAVADIVGLLQKAGHLRAGEQLLTLAVEVARAFERAPVPDRQARRDLLFDCRPNVPDDVPQSVEVLEGRGLSAACCG